MTVKLADNTGSNNESEAPKQIKNKNQKIETKTFSGQKI